MTLNASPLDKYSRHISSEDARMLSRFFGDSSGYDGIYSGHSAFGAQLERAARLAFGSRTCAKCQGAGWLPKRRKKPTVIDVALQEFQIAAKEELPNAMECWCPSCGGRGIVPKKHRSSASKALTARPTGSSRTPLEGGSATSDQEAADIADAGRAMNRLGAVEALQPGARVVLSLYYSRDSGGTLALWRLTPAGQTMVRNNPRKLAPEQLFANLRDAQSRQDVEDAREYGDDARRSRRKALLDAAAEQAQELIGRAHQAWNASAPAKKPRPAKPQERVKPRKDNWVAELEAELAQLLGAA